MQTPPAPPSAPTVPAPIGPLPATASQGASGVAPQAAFSTTVSEVLTFSYDQLRARGEELSRQLSSVTSRRNGLSRDLRRAPETVKDGLQSQISQLNTRIVQIEQDIAVNGQQKALASAREAGTTTSTGDGGSPRNFMPSPGDITAITIVFTLFVLCPIALSLSRLIWKRGSRLAAAPVSRESDLRMERVEQAVDAIAVEVERISEGQRFVTQLMTQQNALGQGAAQPVRVSVADPIAASWQQR